MKEQRGVWGNPRRILAATSIVDLSPVITADRLALETGAWLDICHVVPDPWPGRDPLFTALQELPLSLGTRKEMVRAVAQKRVSEVTGREEADFGLHVLAGNAAERIFDAVELLGADLLVVGPGTFRRWWWRKGVVESLIRAGRIPLVVARPSIRCGEVLVATDLATDFPVLAEGMRIAARERAHLTAVNVVPIVPGPYDPLALSDYESWIHGRTRDTRARVARACASLGASDGEVGVRVESGQPAEEIARLARQLHAEFVVVGSRTNSWAHFLPSVSQSVVDLAPCSVVVLPLDC